MLSGRMTTALTAPVIIRCSTSARLARTRPNASWVDWAPLVTTGRAALGTAAVARLLQPGARHERRLRAFGRGIAQPRIFVALGRRILRVHLGADTEQGLERLAGLVDKACAR